MIGAGQAAYRMGNDNAAAQLFHQALGRAPGNATIYFDLGSAYQAEGDATDALANYAQALRRDPTMATAIFNQATIYAVHDPQVADLLYLKVIRLQPNSSTAYLNLGLLEARQGAADQAGEDLRKAIALEPSLRTRIPAGVVADLTAPAPTSRRRAQPGTTTTTSRP